MRAVLIALFITLASQAAAQDGEESGFVGDNGRQQTAEGDRAASGFSLPIRIIEGADEAERTKRREDDADRREQEDLAAQTAMAEASLELVEVSWRQTQLAAIGTALVFLSLCLSAWAAKSAVNANAISRQHFAAENRPWIRIKGTVGLSHYWDENSGWSIVGEARICNVGKTPAVAVSAQIMVEKRPPIAFADNKFTVKFAESVVAGAGKTGGAMVVFPDPADPYQVTDSTKDFPSGGGRLRAIFCVTYKAAGFDSVYYAATAVEFQADEIAPAEGDIIQAGDAYFTPIRSARAIAGSEAMI